LSSLFSGSRRTFRQLIFQLTGEVVRDIYASEDTPNVTPAWHKPTLRKQRYFKGRNPPTTQDGLLPVVQVRVRFGRAVREVRVLSDSLISEIFVFISEKNRQVFLQNAYVFRDF
jgi:hypothetical protein